MGIKGFGAWIEFFRGLQKKSSFSNNNHSLPETMLSGDEQNRKSFGSFRYDNILLFIDLTSIIFSCYKSLCASYRNDTGTLYAVYCYFEKLVAKEIYTGLCSIKNECPFCKSKNHFFADSAFRTRQNTLSSSDKDDFRCQCQNKSVSEMLNFLRKDESINNGIYNVAIVLLYDSRNLNPMCRNMTAEVRYKNNTVEETITNETLLSFTSKYKDKFSKLGSDLSASVFNEEKEMANFPENEHYMLEYIGVRYRYMVMEKCISILLHEIFEKNSQCGFPKKILSKYDSSLNLLSKISIIVDSIPCRIINFFEGFGLNSTNVLTPRFTNEQFTKLFYEQYNDAVGGNKHQLNSYFEWEQENIITNQTEGMSDILPTWQKSHLGNIKSDNVCISYNHIDKISTIYWQDFGVTENIGEADIKFVPYIVDFVNQCDKVYKCCDKKRNMIWVKTNDSDWCLILLCFLQNIFEGIKEGYGIGSFNVKFNQFFYGNTKSNFDIILDMGQKEENSNTDFSTKILDVFSGLPSPQVGTLQLDTEFERNEPFDQHEQVNNKNSKNVNNNKKHNPRFIDVLSLFKSLHEKFGSKLNSLFLFIIFGGGDYTENPKNFAATRMAKLIIDNFNSANCVLGSTSHASTLLTKSRIGSYSYVWSLEESEIFRMGLIFYYTLLPKYLSKVSARFKAKLQDYERSVESDSKVFKTAYQKLYDEVRSEKSDYPILSPLDFYSELSRCCWVLNYYLGCECFNMHCCEIDHNGANFSKWGWIMTPEDNNVFVNPRLSISEISYWNKFMTNRIDYDGDTEMKEEEKSDSLQSNYALNLLKHIKTQYSDNKNPIYFRVIKDNTRGGLQKSQ